MMSILQYFNERVKRFSLLDIKLVQGTGIFVALILAKLLPEIMDVSIWWFVCLLFLSTMKPFYVIFVRK